MWELLHAVTKKLTFEKGGVLTVAKKGRRRKKEE